METSTPVSPQPLAQQQQAPDRPVKPTPPENRVVKEGAVVTPRDRAIVEQLRREEVDR